MSYANGAEADVEAHRQLINKFREAFATGNRDILQDVYTENGMYFKRSGNEYYGREAVLEGLMPSSTPEEDGAESESSGPFNIVIDTIKTGDKLGYIFGRVCVPSGESEVCDTRWFLVTEKGEDGQWRVDVDLDLPFRSKTMSAQ